MKITNPSGYLLVTGGAGFIGSNLIEYLLSQRPALKIVNIDDLTYAGSPRNMSGFMDDPRHVFVKGNICDSTLLRQLFDQYHFMGVMHLAAESHVDNSISSPEPFIRSNIEGTFHLLEASRTHCAHFGKFEEFRFHQISTDEVFGSLGEKGVFTETSPYAPNSPYSASKAAADLLVRSYHKTYGLNTLVTNCSNNYGPNQHTEKLIPTIIRMAISDGEIPIYGDGSNVRDWLYVEDHCSGLLALFEGAEPGSQYLLGGGKECSNLEIAQLVCRILDELRPKRKGSYADQISLVQDRPGHDWRYSVCIEKVNKDIGWTPETEFMEGLRNTVIWYLKNRIDQ